MFDTYIALGFGSSMKDTNIIVWESYSPTSLSTPAQLDTYSTDNHKPVIMFNTYTTDTPI